MTLLFTNPEEMFEKIVLMHVEIKKEKKDTMTHT